MAFDLKDENWSAELVLPVANQGLHSIFKSVTETQRKIYKNSVPLLASQSVVKKRQAHFTGF